MSLFKVKHGGPEAAVLDCRSFVSLPLRPPLASHRNQRQARDGSEYEYSENPLTSVLHHSSHPSEQSLSRLSTLPPNRMYAPQGAQLESSQIQDLRASQPLDERMISRKCTQVNRIGRPLRC